MTMNDVQVGWIGVMYISFKKMCHTIRPDYYYNNKLIPDAGRPHTL